MTYTSDVEAIDTFHKKTAELKQEIAKTIVGQDAIIDNILLSLFSKGHCLLIGVPGLAKTLIVTTIAKTLGLTYSRIQFTPDLMPSDIVGSEILDEKREFKFYKGPVFANLVLADEINRTPPKTQSALLEAMQEHAVTVSGVSYTLQQPFFVLATQNPIEQEGTYPLPEAQLDRFMFSLFLDYPSFDEEVEIVKRTTGTPSGELHTILSAEEIIAFQNAIRKLPIADNVCEYAVQLVSKTRVGTAQAAPSARQYLSWGAGPRASQYLVLGAKCHAAMKGKYSPDIEDINAVACPVLQHRVVTNYSAEAEGIKPNHIIQTLLAQ